jgi:hypothetical protein
MTDQSKPKIEKIENLDQQEVEELTPGEAEAAQGGTAHGAHIPEVILEPPPISPPRDPPPPPPPPPPPK